MRIVLFAEFYPMYVADFHARNAATAATLDYQGHVDLLCGDFFNMFVSYRTHFRRIGWEAELIVANYYQLQQKWLDERGIAITASTENRKEVALKQIEAMEPDVFFIPSNFEYYGDFLGKVAKLTPNIIAWIACVFPPDLDLSHIRCVLSEDEWFPKQFRRMGAQSERMLHSFDPDVLGKLIKRPPSIRASFVGGITTEHRIRAATLKWLAKKRIGLELWGYVHLTRSEKRLNWIWPNPLLRRHHGPVWGLDMFQTLADSVLTLNFHIDISAENKTGGNQRVYEATGAGTLLLSDIEPDASIPGNFKAGRDMLVFHSRDELLEMIRYFAAKPAEAAAIARAGQKACLENHGFNIRVREFEAHIHRYCDL